MQGYLDELSKIIKMPIDEIYKEYKIIYIGGRIVEILNFIKILCYSNEQIALKVTNNVINIEGSKLNIKELSKKDIVVSGNINKIYLSKEMIDEENHR